METLDTSNFEPETLPDLSALNELAEPVGGPWPKGWYPAEIIEGYTAGNYQFVTTASLSKKGDSFNLRICFRVTNGSDARTNFHNFNYRPIDFTTERIEAVKRLRAEFAGQKGRWGGHEDTQRSSLALGQLGQLQTAAGTTLQMNDSGQIVTSPLVGRSLFVRLTIDEETGYNEITGFSAHPTGTPSKEKKGA